MLRRLVPQFDRSGSRPPEAARAPGHRRLPGIVALLAALACHLAVAAIPPRPHPLETLGVPPGDWPLIRKTPVGFQTYLIPSQLRELRRLPEPERSETMRFVRTHQANLKILRTSGDQLQVKAEGGRLHSRPEYLDDMAEAIMSVDAELAATANPIWPHEPVLAALPDYTRVILLTPRSALDKVRARLATTGLERRVRVVDVGRPAPGNAEGVTRWIRDVIHIAHLDRQTVVETSAAHLRHDDLARNDLAPLARIGDRERKLLRLPLFFRGGNLARVDHGRRLLLIGADELAMNREWFVESFGFTPRAGAVQEILRTATGVDEIVVLPNSRNFYHLDMYLTPLGPGMVGLLAPLDGGALAAADRQVLDQAGARLAALGLRIVPIPSRSEWIASFRSPTNSVAFTERGTGRRRALVPQFPESAGAAPAGLNRRVLDAYRAAGIEPIAVEERFHSRWGNTHCALVALR